MSAFYGSKGASLLLVALFLLGTGVAIAQGSHPSNVPAQSTIPHLWGNQTPGWTMFHGNSNVNGSYGGAFPYSHFRVLWEQNYSVLAYDPANNNYQPLQSSPVVYNGSVYVPDGTTGNVLQINASTGAITGIYDLSLLVGNTETVQSTPLIVTVGGYPYLVFGTDHNHQYVFSLNLTSSSATYCTPGQSITGSATGVAPSNILFGAASNRNVWNFGTSPLPNGGCPGAWSTGPTGALYDSTPSVGFIYTSVGTATNYFLSDTGNHQVDAFNAATKTNTWADPVAQSLYGSVALTNITYNDTGGVTTVAPLGFVADDKNGAGTSHLYALDVNCGLGPGQCFGTGTPQNNNIGTFAFSNATSNVGVNSTVALESLSPYQTRVLYATAIGNLSGVVASLETGVNVIAPFNPNGYSINWTDSWNYSTGAGFAASPVTANNLVMDGNVGGGFYILDASNGNPVWTHQFSGSFFASPAISNGDIYVLTSTGELADIAPAALPVQLAAPSPVAGGTNVALTATVSNLNVTGQSNGTVSGAGVSFYVRGGAYSHFVYLGTNTTNSTGVATFSWLAPSVNSNITYDFVARASAPGYLNGSTTAQSLVLASIAPPSMSLTITPSSTVIYSNQTTQVAFLLTSGGTGVGGGQIALVSPASSYWHNGVTLTTNSVGQAWDNLSSPAPINATTSVLVYATASAVGYSNTSGAAAVTFSPNLPAGTPQLALSCSPLSSSIQEGTTAVITVTVVNASSTAAVSGAQVTATLSSTAFGTFSVSQGNTSAAGKVTFTFTGFAPGTVLATFSAALSGYVGAAGSTAISVLAPASTAPGLTVSIAAQSATAPGVPVTLTLSGSEVNATTGALQGPAAGATVSISFVGGAGSSTLSTPSVTLNSTGENNSAILTPGLSQSPYVVTLSYQITLSGYASGKNVSSVTVIPPPLVVAANVAPTVIAGSHGTLSVTVTSVGGAAVKGAQVTVHATPTTAVTLANASGTTNAQGIAVFSFTATTTANTSAGFTVSASLNGYAPASNATRTLVVASQTTGGGGTTQGPQTYFGLRALDWILLAILLILLIALIAALSRRGGGDRGRSSSSAIPNQAGKSSGGNVEQETAVAGAMAGTETLGAASAAPARTEWSEEEAIHETSASEVVSSSDTSSAATPPPSSETPPAEEAAASEPIAEEKPAAEPAGEASPSEPTAAEEPATEPAGDTAPSEPAETKAPEPEAPTEEAPSPKTEPAPTPRRGRRR